MHNLEDQLNEQMKEREAALCQRIQSDFKEMTPRQSMHLMTILKQDYGLQKQTDIAKLSSDSLVSIYNMMQKHPPNKY